MLNLINLNFYMLYFIEIQFFMVKYQNDMLKNFSTLMNLN